MDVIDSLDALEQYIRQSPTVPFTQLRAVDREQLQGLLGAARQEAERLQREPPRVPSRDALLNQAESEGTLLVEAARHEADETLRDDRIQLLSRQRFDEVAGEGKQKGDARIRAAYAYTVERMSAIDQQLARLNEQVGSSLELLQTTAKEAEKARHQRGKEVSRAQAKERRRKLRQMFFG